MAATHDEQGLEHMEVCPSVTQVSQQSAHQYVITTFQTIHLFCGVLLNIFNSR